MDDTSKKKDDIKKKKDSFLYDENGSIDISSIKHINKVNQSFQRRTTLQIQNNMNEVKELIGSANEKLAITIAAAIKDALKPTKEDVSKEAAKHSETRKVDLNATEEMVEDEVASKSVENQGRILNKDMENKLDMKIPKKIPEISKEDNRKMTRSSEEDAEEQKDDDVEMETDKIHDITSMSQEDIHKAMNEMTDNETLRELIDFNFQRSKDLEINHNLVIECLYRFDDRIKNLEKKLEIEIKKNKDANNKPNNKPADNFDTDFPQLEKSKLPKTYSIASKKPRKVVQINDESEYVNNNLKDVRTYAGGRAKENIREEVQDDIKKIVKEKLDEVTKEGKNKPKKEDIVNLDTKVNHEMLVMTEMRNTIGIKTKSDNAINLIVQEMDKAKPNRKLTKEQKRISAARNFLEDFVKNKLKIENEEWKAMNIEKIHVGKIKDTDGLRVEVVYVMLDKTSDVSYIKSKLPDIEDAISNRIINYVHESAYQRFKSFEHIAYNYRQKNMNTRIFNGKYDFLLLVKAKGDNTKWTDIPPTIIDEDLLNDFDVGILSPEDKAFDDLNRIERKNKLVMKNNKIKEMIAKDIAEEDRRMVNEAGGPKRKQKFCIDHHDDSCQDCFWSEEELHNNAQPMPDSQAHSIMSQSQAGNPSLNISASSNVSFSNVSSSSLKSPSSKSIATSHTEKRIKLSKNIAEKKE